MVKRYFKNPRKLIRVLGGRGFFNWLPDRPYLKLVYWGETGNRLNLNNPTAFNEKIQWLKLYDRKLEYSKFVDKYEVRAYVEEKIGEDYLIPLIGIYNNIEEIDWCHLPDQFVLKCTHGSHCNIICTNKANLNITEINNKLQKWLKHNWYWFGREWPYKNITGKIICEQFLGELNDLPNDYKIMCFNGEPQIVQIHRKNLSGQHLIDFYSMEGNQLPFRKKGFANSDVKFIDIESLKEMFDLARRLSEGTKYIRTDFYFVRNKIYFGELTLYDSSGLIDFEPKWSNYFLGEKLNFS